MGQSLFHRVAFATSLISLWFLLSPLASAEEVVFKGKLAKDKGAGSWGTITLGEQAIIVETHHFPFRVDTEGVEYSKVNGTFAASHGLFRGSVTFPTTDGRVTLLTKSKQTRALIDMLKAKLLDTPQAPEAPPLPVAEPAQP